METINQRICDRDCHGRFADTAGTDNADEAQRLQLLRQGTNGVIAADHPRRSRRQPLNSFCGCNPGNRSRLPGA
jgi:hypothetical protein